MGLKISYAVGVAFLLVLVIVAIAFWWFVPNRAGPTTVVGALAPRIEQTKSGIAVTGMYAVEDADGNLALPEFVWDGAGCSATFPIAQYIAETEDWSEYAGLHTSIRTHGRLSLTLPNDRSWVEGEMLVGVVAAPEVALSSLGIVDRTLVPAFAPEISSYNTTFDAGITIATITAASTTSVSPTITVDATPVPATVMVGDGGTFTIIVEDNGVSPVETSSYTINYTVSGSTPASTPAPLDGYTKFAAIPLEKAHPHRDDDVVTVSFERGGTAAFPDFATQTPFGNSYRVVEVMLRIDDVDEVECKAISNTAFWEDLASATVQVHPSSDCDDIPSGGGEGDQLTKESDDNCDVGWEAEETVRIYYGKVDIPGIINLASLTKGNITGASWSLGVYDIPVAPRHHHVQARNLLGGGNTVKFVLAVPKSMLVASELRDYFLHDWITSNSQTPSVSDSALEIGGIPYVAYVRNVIATHEHTYTLIFGGN